MPVHKITNNGGRVNRIGQVNPKGTARSKKYDLQAILVLEDKSNRFIKGVCILCDSPGRGVHTLHLTSSAAVELVKGILLNVDDITFAVDEELRKLITEKYDRQDKESQAVVDCLKRDVAHHTKAKTCHLCGMAMGKEPGDVHLACAQEEQGRADRTPALEGVVSKKA